MVCINRIEFKNVTIIYDEGKINKKLCKKKNVLMNLWCLLSSLMMFILLIAGSLIIYNNMPEILSILILLVFFLVFGFVLVSFGYWLIYRNTIKAYAFVEWLFRMKEVYAGWYNGKILLRVKHSNGVDDYSLQGFVRSIKNELEITDKSDRSKPIHIFVDVTHEEKTNILIENV